MTLPSVSIVMPAFNSESLITDTINCLKAMDYPSDRLELIVVDDGSVDNTASVATERIKTLPFRGTVICQENRGPSAARNTGWRRAEGEWIQFLDADDRVNSVKLRTQCSRAEQMDHSVAVLYSPWIRQRITGKGECSQTEVCDPHVDDDPILELLRTKNFIATGSQIFRRAWLERVNGFDETMRFIEDVNLALRIAIAGGRFQRVPSEIPLFTYQQRDNSLSNSSRSLFFRGCLKNAEMAQEYWRRTQTELSASQREMLTQIHATALRVFSEVDRNLYRETLDRLQSLAPAFRPGGTSLRMLSRIVGIEIADRIAVTLRRLRAKLQTRRLGKT